MATVLLAGAYGQGNPGDEALLSAFLQALPDWDVVATSSAPAVTEAAHGCRAVPARGGAVSRALRSADAYLIGGGTVFKELHPAAGRRPLALLERATATVVASRAAGKPTAAVGVGAGSLGSARARALARLLVRATDLLVLRDEESALVLERAGATRPFRIGADPAWAVLDPDTVPAGGAPADGPIVVVPSLLASSDRDELARDLFETLAPVVAAGLPVALLPWQVGGTVDERELAGAVARRVGADVLEPPGDLGVAKDLLRGARLVVGFRFHALVTAAAVGAPFLAVTHEPKLVALARRLGQASVGADTAPGLVSEAIVDAAIAQRPAPASSVRTEVVRATETLKLLRLLLSGGEQADADPFADLTLFPQVLPR